MTTYAPVPRGALPRLPIDPRIRARRVAVMRDEGRRRLRRVVGVLSLGAVTATIVGIALSPFLAVDTVAVTGVETTRTDDVRAVAGVDSGDPALFVDTGAVEEKVATLAWVARVRVERELPGTVRISVTERTPVGWVAREGEPNAIVDGRGVVIDTATDVPAGLPQLPALSSSGSTAAAPTLAARAAAVLPPRVRKIATRVGIADGQVAIVLAERTELRFGDGRNLRAKARAAVAVLEATGLALPAYVDVSVPSAPVTG